MHVDNYNALWKDNDSAATFQKSLAKTDNAIIDLRPNLLLYVTCVPKYSIDENENNLNIREIVNIVKING